MKTLSGIFTLVVIATAAGQASAVNKCTSPNGSVSYQAAPCEAAAKAEQPTHIQSQGLPSSERWDFSKQKDEMTGRTTCFAVSPSAFLMWGRGGYNKTRVRIQIAASPEAGLSLTVRSTTGGPTFHPKFAGSGIKIDNNDFLPFTRSIESHGLGFEQGTQPIIIGQLASAQSFRARVRMWPFDELLDTDPISTAGFKGAMQQALACATPK